MSVYQEVELFLKIAEFAGKYSDQLAYDSINLAMTHLSNNCFPCGTAADHKRAELEKQMQMKNIKNTNKDVYSSIDWGSQTIGQLDNPAHAGDACWNVQNVLAGSGIAGKAAGTFGFAENHNTATGSVVDNSDRDCSIGYAAQQAQAVDEGPLF